MNRPPARASAFALALALAVAALLPQCSKRDDEEQTGSGAAEEIVINPLRRLAPGAVQSQPLAPRDSGGDALFQRIPAGESGIDFVHRWAPPNKAVREQIMGPFAGGAVALGDIDNDGLPEVFLTRPHGGSRLYLNLGGFKFRDITSQSGIGGALGSHWTSGATFVDIQGDGYLDLYLCAYAMPNKLFINTGDGRFVENAAQYGLAFSGASIMASFVDYDRDGDLDAHLLTNRLARGGPPPRGRIDFKVIDGQVIAPKPYRDEIGAIRRKDGSLHPIQAGQADLLLRNDEGRFTDVAGRAGLIDHSLGLSATWWDCDSDGWIDLYVANDFFGPDHLYRNNRNGTFTDVIAEAVPNTPWFSMGSDTGDLDGDGRLDFIATDMAAPTHYKQKVNMGDMDAEGWFLELGNPRQYMRNAVYLNTGTPRFLEAAQMAGLSATDWTWAVRIADFDCDRRNDVFFSNGMTRDFFNADTRAEVRRIYDRTGENRWGDYPPLKERNLLFQNRGNLAFEEVSRQWGLGEETVSFGAATGDLDGDGDLDLFVGARVIPGKYPTSPPSRLLLNDGAGRFSDAPPEAAAALAGAGMVTDALWSDADRDGDPDLLVTTEYGPVKFYRNDGGKLVEATAAAGLAERLGWWNCIAAADVDRDGDIDYAVGDFGWNTRYHPTRERPQLLYYGDFDGLGKSHCVEAHRDGDSIVPNRGRSCSSGAMPFIKEKFGNFHDFAVADLAEIFTKSKLERSLKLEANELASGILRNDGKGKFEFHPLPRLAQIAPSLGLVFLEADGDCPSSSAESLQAGRAINSTSMPSI